MQVLKLKQLQRKRREKGLTLIEGSMMLALSAVVVASAIAYYQSASDNNKLQSAQGELGGLQTAVAALYSTASIYTGIDTPGTFDGQTAITPNYITGSLNAITGFTDPWGGKVTMAPVNSPDGTVDGNYSITFAGVPQGSCSAMAVQSLGGSLISFKIGSSTAASGAAFSPASAAAACSDPSNNTLTWILS